MVAWLGRHGLMLIVAVGFVLRLFGRRAVVPGGTAGGAYDFYLEIARTWVHGGGLCQFAGAGCALRLPGYPLFLSLFLRGGVLAGGWVITQAVAGAALVFVAYRIAEELFGRRAALGASVLTALSPYAIVHDVALQDTVGVNLLVGLAIWSLLRLRRSDSHLLALAAGCCLAAAALTTARVALVVLAALAWVPAGAGAGWSARLRKTALVALPVVVLCGAWLIRNHGVTGSFVWTTESGQSLWAANNAATAQVLPWRSIDLSVLAAYQGLSSTDRHALEAVQNDEVAADRLAGDWAGAYIAAHPIETLRMAVVKMLVPVVPLLSPTRSLLTAVGFCVVYVPIHLLALRRAWRIRARWRDHLLPALFVASFLLTTAVYWAHTSHASVIDVLWFVYASAARGSGSVEPGATI